MTHQEERSAKALVASYDIATTQARHIKDWLDSNPPTKQDEYQAPYFTMKQTFEAFEKVRGLVVEEVMSIVRSQK